MTKINSPEDLLRMKEEFAGRLNPVYSPDDLTAPVRIRVAMATCGIASGAREVMDYLTEELEKRSIQATVTRVGCMGYCYAEPTIEVTLPGKEPVVFGEVDIRKADQIIEKFIRLGEPVDGIIPLNYESIDK
ncbi:MAG TPA: (2Fe-2S) ferredoxin domain-containing protein [Bacteroidales bacterium]|nr:(2Fe-2S) ferredoxin domain-containing protein [Bacteroidales bacterium]HRZ50158.1 (2Fe-2S) ferredoxin domain-containing protein [Bacteroidales bacterium]